MFGASCVLLCAAVALSEQAFTYLKPWDPFRRSNTECEMCSNNQCFVTNDARCDYYAESSRVLCDGDEEGHTGEDIDDVLDSNGEDKQLIGKIDSMMYELVDTATSTSMFKTCVPFISQYTDCTEENICIGCKLCTCNEEGRWVCTKRQQCRPGPRVNVDHRVIGVVVDSLNRKRKSHKRDKRSADNKDANDENRGRLSYEEISEWLYDITAAPLNFEKKNIDTVEIVEDHNSNVTADNGYKDTGDDTLSTSIRTNSGDHNGNGSTYYTTDTVMIKNPNDFDMLEFNDILESWAGDMITDKPINEVEATKDYIKRKERPHDDLTEFDPVRLVKRDTQLETNQTQLDREINSTRDIFANVPIIKDALYGLSKIIDEKEKELEELLHIQENLINIAKSYNSSINTNDTNTQDNHNNHQIAIYKIDSFDKCLTKLKHDMYNAIENIIKTEISRNSSSLSTELKVLLKMIKKYIFHKNHSDHDANDNMLSSQESKQDLRKHVQINRNYEVLDPITYLSNILEEINKVPTKPLNKLSQHVRKILKRVIIQLYFNDFAIIDLIVQETHYDFRNYLESIGIKWDKMLQDIAESNISDKLYRTKLLYLTLKTDISKIEDMISVLEFAKNRRMTVTNGAGIEKSIVKIKNNLKLIDNKVQEILKIQNVKRMKKTTANENNKSIKKLSMMQKLKKMFQNSRNEIKNLLRKKVPKSEIMKEIAKKKIEELEKQRMLEYQKTMKQWEEKINVGPGRRKRSAWGFQNFVDRMKSIIPGYLKKKVKPAIHSKKKRNKTRSAQPHGRKRKHKTTTVRTSHKDRVNHNKTFKG
ncbi:uncharacterized protein [Epargyreus clarus]|uniref:uncharacterized protein isoform X2 n=1 Tax=Epargyreus clarus TaxID=520877 RepID=UPI003C2B3BAE